MVDVDFIRRIPPKRVQALEVKRESSDIHTQHNTHIHDIFNLSGGRRVGKSDRDSDASNGQAARAKKDASIKAAGQNDRLFITTAHIIGSSAASNQM